MLSVRDRGEPSLDLPNTPGVYLWPMSEVDAQWIMKGIVIEY